jgi:hypothetical protein
MHTFPKAEFVGHDEHKPIAVAMPTLQVLSVQPDLELVIKLCTVGELFLREKLEQQFVTLACAHREVATWNQAESASVSFRVQNLDRL